ncbi:MAG: hypothetical protein KF741_11435 [Ferruginibacter sp.]|nr:hypothetical protein [Bacteroidota bacterium]MBX2919846.1 hypothetical protein [Ferruginibacter sp.]MCB0709555.1 hypothetical protein [Chitinophagaceae bacterium]
MQIQKINKNRFTFFTAIAMIGIIAILVGFSKTFIIPLVSGTKTWPLTIYAHAFFVFGWVIIFLTQSLLIQNKKYKIHIFIGRWAAFIAVGAAISIIPASLFQIERELKEGLGQTAISSIVGSLASASMFLILVTLGILNRKRPQVHKRFMLLATILLIWPAWFRWRHYFPSVERPDIWFAVVLSDSLILVAFIWDWLKNKYIHPALFYGGLFIIAENVMEILLFDSKGWRVLANTLYTIFN